MANDTPPPAGPPAGSPPPIDPAAFQAVQTENAGLRALAETFLGRQLTAQDTPASLISHVQTSRQAAEQQASALRIGLAESLVTSGLTPAVDLDYLRHRVSNSPEFAEPLKANDWAGVLKAAEKAGLLTRPAAAAPAAPAPFTPPQIRPQAGAPTGDPDPYSGIKSRADMKNMTPLELARFQKAQPQRFEALTRIP